MQCRLAKFYSRLFLSRVLVPLFCLFFSTVSQALITYAPYNGGSISPSFNNGGTFYYYVSYNGTPTGPSAPSFITFTPLDIFSTPSTDTSLRNVLEIVLSTNTPITTSGSEQAIVSVQVLTKGGAAAKQAPIASVDGVACSTANCQAQDFAKGSRFYAAKYYPSSNSVIRIGIYPNDLCYISSYYFSAEAQGCTGQVIDQPTTSAQVTMSIQIAISKAVSGNFDAPIPATAIETIPQALTLSFQNGTPSLVCPSTSTLNTSFAPGDAQIFVNTAAFGVSGPTGTAPPKNLVVVGKIDGKPGVGSTYNAVGNDLVTTVAHGGTHEAVRGFKNSTASTTYDYSLSFLVQDQAGVYVSPSSANDCLLSPVRTAAVQGFLESSNCFIATATYQSPSAAPVRMLREFRDQILLKYRPGQEFVTWYYHWSPKAAAWLNDHPLFRLPVLLWLTPVELFAWLCLNPLYLFGLEVVLVGTILIFVRRDKARGGANLA